MSFRASRRGIRRRSVRVGLVALALGIGYLYQWYNARTPGVSGDLPAAPSSVSTTSSASDTNSSTNTSGEAAILRAFREHRSGLVVEVVGSVDRALSDDNEGSRHQRFILRLDSGHTVLVSHNIDLAPRVPLHRGESVEIRGQYEWNERGGVLHWTHHDPQNRRPGGWIRLGGELYH